MKNIRLDLQYDGSGYCGWQRQLGQPTVEGRLKKALDKVLNEPISMVVAGRTDTGVHARQQVVNFHTRSRLAPLNIRDGTNTELPRDISVAKAVEVPEDWNARHDATQRHYRYRILTANPRSALLRKYVTHLPYKLNADEMQEAANCLVGEHDFTAFRSVHCGAQNPKRELSTVRIRRQGRLVTIDLKATAFLRNMARVIVGTLIEVGRGKIPPDQMERILASRDRTQAGPTAEAQGLTLWAIKYPKTPSQKPRVPLTRASRGLPTRGEAKNATTRVSSTPLL